MKQPISNIRKWLNTVGHHFPVLIPIGGIFACVFLLAAAYNHHQLRQHVVSDGKNSIKELEIYIDDVAGKLQILQHSVGEDCSQQDKLELRSKVFNSRMIKEIGLYKDGVVYCTSNEGRTSIRLLTQHCKELKHHPSI